MSTLNLKTVSNGKTAIAGPITLLLISNNDTGIDDFVTRTNGTLVSEKEIRATTSKLLFLATISKEAGGTKQTNNTNAATTNAKTQSQADIDNLNKLQKNAKVPTTSNNNNSIQEYEFKDSISITHDDVQRIATKFVTERRQLAREAVRRAVKASVSEMSKRHGIIVARAVKNAANNDTSNFKAKQNLPKDNDRLERLKREHKKVINMMEEKHKNEIRTLQNEQERFVVELQRTYQAQIDKLRSENKHDKKVHARALSSYLMASSDALKLLRNLPEDDE